MTIDCTRFKESLDKVRHLMLGSQEPKKLIAKVSGLTHIPAIAVCAYLMVIYPDDASLVSNFDTLKSFYGYTEVIKF